MSVIIDVCCVGGVLTVNISKERETYTA